MTATQRKRRRHLRWARFLRLIVTCFAFLLVRPAAAASAFDAIDQIVVVAGSRTAAPEKPSVHRATKHASHAAYSSLPLARRSPLGCSASEPAAALFTPLGDAPVYLRNCSLLC